VAGSRVIPLIRARLGGAFLPTMGMLGSASLLALVLTSSVPVMVVGFFGFGLAFVSLQSTLIMAAQMRLPQLRGTAMSLASFAMFVGGGVGTQINGMIVDSVGASLIYAPAAVFVLLTALAAMRLSRRPSPAAAPA
ncbi:MAG: MFS transporter, partial [Spirochaetota bacterium]